MLKAYKTEINPTKQQINQFIGICRYLYNSYLAKTQELYSLFKDGKLSKKEAKLSANSFDKYINNEVKVLEDFKWIDNCGSKARKKAICNAETAFNKFLKGESKFPRFKKKNKSNNEGIGVDLGLKDFAICSNGLTKKNINKTKTVKKIEKKLKREQRTLSRKYESLKIRNKNIKKEGGNATRQNIQKQIVKVQKLHQTLSNIRENYLNQTVNELVKIKPSHITIEDLNVRGMMKNKHLSKAISKQGFNMFRVKLTNKCNEYGIELRIVDRFYPSSKTCHKCGTIKKDLKLSDRIYKCECGYEIDRDLNASLNLRDAKIYKVA